MKNQTQKGFVFIEGLLILAIIAVIAGTGYYVWHHSESKNKTPVANATTPQTTKNKSTPTDNPSNTNSKKYFTISQWGVEAPYSGSLTLEYTINTDNQGLNYASFSSTQLDAADPTCKSSGDYGGSIERFKSSAEYLIGDGELDSGKTAAQYAATLGSSDYGHVGDYYFFYSHPQGICSDSGQNIQTQTDSAVNAMIPSLQAIPQ